MKSPDTNRPEPIAIVGMECVFPGARNLQAFWSNIVRGVDAIREIDPERWNPADYGLGTVRGGFIDRLVDLDPAELHVMPASIREGDPEQFLVATVIRRALRDAGGSVDGATDHERTEVVIGRGGYLGDSAELLYLRTEVLTEILSLFRQLGDPVDPEVLEKIREQLNDSLPAATAESVACSIPNLSAGRVSNRFDFRGASFTVDAACASALIAVDSVMRSLREGRCDLGIAAAVHLIQKPHFLMAFKTLGALSPSGNIRPFDARADGLVMAEGLGALVLKRLSDARAAGDRVYAVIRAVGIASDGRGAGIMTPRVDGEILALRRAYAAAEVDPHSVTLIEGHGTGTAIGDRTEIEALRTVFDGADHRGVALGSVKSMIGHTMPAAGMAGMIKAALSVYHRLRPATIGLDQPRAELEGSRIFAITHSQPWISPPDQPRRAGVNAFGFGGINAHAILEQAPPEAGWTSLTPFSSELFVLGAESQGPLVEKILQWEQTLDENPGLDPGDIACTAASDWAPADHRLAIVSSSPEDLRWKLEAFRTALESGTELQQDGVYFGTGDPLGKAVVIFPGMGFPGLGAGYTERFADLCLHFPVVREALDMADGMIEKMDPDGAPLAEQFFPPPLLGEAERIEIERNLALSSRTWVGLLMTHVGLWNLMKQLEFQPDAITGFSLGEVSALMAGGVLDLGAEDARNEIARVWSMIEGQGSKIESDNLWAMVASSSDKVEAICSRVEGPVGVAMDVSPGQVFIAGREDAVREAIRRLSLEKIWAQELPQVSSLVPFFGIHTELGEALSGDFRTLVGSFPLASPAVPIYRGTGGELFPSDPDGIAEAMLESVVLPVRLHKTIRSLYENGYRIFIHMGAWRLLLHNVRGALAHDPHLAIAIDDESRNGLDQLHHMLAAMAAGGLTFKPSALFRNRPCSRIRVGRENVRGLSLPVSLSPPRLRPRRDLIENLRNLLRLERPVGVSESPRASPNPPNPGAGALGLAALDEMQKTFDTFLRVEEENDREQDRVMREFLNLQESLAEGMAGAPARVDPGESNLLDATPLVGDIRVLDPGARMQSRLRLDLERHGFLADHALLRIPAGLKPVEELLPTLPLTFGAEMFAEAASVLLPGRFFLACHSVEASRWIALQSRRTLEIDIRAERIGENEVAVEIQPEDQDRPALRGVVIMGRARPEPPSPMNVAGSESPRHTAEEFYRIGPLFHGSRFHVIRSLDAITSSTLQGTLRVPAASEWLSDAAGWVPRVDPMILDGLGQLVGYLAWLGGRLVLPIGFARLSLFGPAPEAGSHVEGRIRIRESNGQLLVADLDVLDSAGRLWMRVEGWQDWRMVTPPGMTEAGHRPRDLRVSSVVESENGSIRATATLRDLGNLEPSWIARVYLRRDEWDRWLEEPDSSTLLSIVAAKDAFREWLRIHHGVQLHPLEVAVAMSARADGRILLKEPKTAMLAAVLEIDSDRATAEVQLQSPS